MHPNREEIDDQVNRIACSADFDATERTQKFLRFIVDQKVNNRSEEISQYSIAIQVFERNENFDPASDPIVRIQAGRLRRSLEHYYLTAGASDLIEIVVSKGSYIPNFKCRNQISAITTNTLDKGETIADNNVWPALMVAPFLNLTNDLEKEYIGQSLATELNIELDRYQIVRVFTPSLSGMLPSADFANSSAPFKLLVEGSVMLRSGKLGILLRLLDTCTGEQIWSRQFRCDLNDSRFSSFLDEVAISTAAALADERGMIIQHMIRKQNEGDSILDGSHEAILQFYHCNVNPTLENIELAMASLKNAALSDPDRGLIWSLLARMHAMNHTLEVMSEASSLDDAYEFALKGVRLDPESQRTHGVLAFIYFLRNEPSAALKEADVALSLNPHSLNFLDALGYLLLLLGDWDRGVVFAEKALRLNPYHLYAAHWGLWLNYFRLGQADEACQHALAIGDDGGFWSPLIRAISFMELGESKKAKDEVQRLLIMKPDFAERATWFISCYVKFPELVERMLEKLHQAGLKN